MRTLSLVFPGFRITQTRARAFALSATVLCSSLSACKGSDEDSKAEAVAEAPSYDFATVVAEFEKRVALAVDTPAVSATIDKMFDKILDDPRLTPSTDALMAKVSANPDLAATAATLVNSVAESKELQRILVELMAANPGMTPDQVGEAVGAKIEKIMDGPAFDVAFDKSMDKLLAAPQVHRAFDLLGDAAAKNPQMLSFVSDLVSSPAKLATWNTRLKELNGGVAPSQTKANELLLKNWLSADRLEKFYIDMFSSPAVQKHVTDAVIELVAEPAFAQHTIKLLEAMAADPELKPRFVNIIDTLLREGASEADISATLDPVLMNPALADAIGEFVNAIVTDDALGAIGSNTLNKALKDPEVNKLFDDLLTNW